MYKTQTDGRGLFAAMVPPNTLKAGGGNSSWSKLQKNMHHFLGEVTLQSEMAFPNNVHFFPQYTQFQKNSTKAGIR